MSFWRYGMMDYLRHVSNWVWHEQDEARHYGLKLQEETITEILLLRMARECSHRGLKIKMFNRIQEGGNKNRNKAGNGADWEWYVKTGSCNVGFRIQAKVLSSDLTRNNKLSIGKYESLKKGSPQIKQLIDGAQKVGFNPIYVFYNHPWVSDRALFSNINRSFSVRPGDWGCAVAAAQFIQGQSTNTLNDLINGMLPWHLFFGWDQGCMIQNAMNGMPGDQEFVRESDEPKWLGMMLEGDEGVTDYLIENHLQGVAYFDFTAREG